MKGMCTTGWCEYRRAAEGTSAHQFAVFSEFEVYEFDCLQPLQWSQPVELP
jgi:hypothetical protein